jgi:hypothetical protein
LRNQWNSSRNGGGRVGIFGIDLAGSFTQVIDNLDQNLISGLGSGVSIEYAKEIQKNAAPK